MGESCWVFQGEREMLFVAVPCSSELMKVMNEGLPLLTLNVLKGYLKIGFLNL